MAGIGIELNERARFSRAMRVRSISAAAPGRLGVYAYEDGALASFRAAQSLGVARLYDLPIGYWRAARRLLDAEQARWPEWQSTLPWYPGSARRSG